MNTTQQIGIGIIVFAIGYLLPAIYSHLWFKKATNEEDTGKFPPGDYVFPLYFLAFCPTVNIVTTLILLLFIGSPYEKEKR